MPDMRETPEAGAQTQSNGCILSLWTRFVGPPHQCHASLPRDQPLFRRSLTPQRATPRQVIDGLLQYQVTRE